MDTIPFFLLLGGLGIAWLVFRKSKTTPKKAIQKAIQKTKYKALEPYVVAQAQHESGNFTSPLFLKQLNPWGMGVPFSRTFVGQKGNLIVEGTPKLQYNSIEQAVTDLTLYFDYTRFPLEVSNAKEYAQQLKKRNYYTDSLANYSKALERWMF